MLDVFNIFGNLLPNTNNTNPYPAKKVVDDLTNVLDSLSSFFQANLINPFDTSVQQRAQSKHYPARGPSTVPVSGPVPVSGSDETHSSSYPPLLERPVFIPKSSLQEEVEKANNKANITKQKIAKLYNLILDIEFYFFEPGSCKSNIDLDKYKKFCKEITNPKVPISSFKENILDLYIVDFYRIKNDLYNRKLDKRSPQEKNELIKQFKKFKALHYYKETIEIFNILKKNSRWDKSLNNIEYDLARNFTNFNTALSPDEKDKAYQQIERIYFAIKSHHSTL